MVEIKKETAMYIQESMSIYEKLNMKEDIKYEFFRTVGGKILP